jgi:hypothetical protein
MLRKAPSQRPASAMELQCDMEQCLADVERRESLPARIALPLKIGRQWLTVAPWTRRAAIFGASAMALVLAVDYYWNSDPPPPSASAIQMSGFVRAQDSGNLNQWLATEMPDWSYLSGWDEPFRSLALAPLLSFAEPGWRQIRAVPDPNWMQSQSTRAGQTGKLRIPTVVA